MAVSEGDVMGEFSRSDEAGGSPAVGPKVDEPGIRLSAGAQRPDLSDTLCYFGS